jgi:CSLREA domain-containing protein
MHVGEVRFLLRSVAAAVAGLLLFAAGASAATITVDSTADTTGGGICTLRDAINTANKTPSGPFTTYGSCEPSPNISGADNITFTLGAGPHTIQLGSALPSIVHDATITGPGASSLTVRGEVDASDPYRIFQVDSDSNFGGLASSVTLEGMTITNGTRGVNDADGAALTLNGVTVSGNVLTDGPNVGTSGAGGAGIENGFGGNVSINASTISGNSATATTTGAGVPVPDGVFTFVKGAAVDMSQGGNLSIDQSTISNNTASANGNQTAQATGAIFNDSPVTTISRSTISGNTATATVSEAGGAGSANVNGGAITQQGASSSAPDFSLDRVTLTGNTAATVTGSASGSGSAVGGGILLVQTVGGSLTGRVQGSTIAGNTVSETGPGSASLRGANVDLNVNDTNNELGQEFSFKDTIIANGSGATNCATENDSRFVSAGYNLDSGLLGTGSSTDSCLQGGTTGDQASTDPALGPLQDNGGTTFTRAPGINSPAVDKGTANGALTDQRSFARTFDMNPSSATGGDGTDIGAFEQQIVLNPATTLPFGSQQWGTTSSSDTAFLRNRTGNNLTFGSLALGGTNPGDFLLGGDSCSNLALGGNSICGVNVTFHPVSANNGAKTATLSFPTDAAPTQSISVTGSATEYVSIAPTPHDFGSTQTGTPTGATQFVVTNAGPGISGTFATTLTGANASEFEVTGDTCAGQTLAALGTCSVSVRFAPATAGAKSASLNVTGTPGGTSSAALTGTGTAPPPPPPPPSPAAAAPTGQRAAALKKCKKKKTAKARKKCKKKANRLPV